MYGYLLVGTSCTFLIFLRTVVDRCFVHTMPALDFHPGMDDTICLYPHATLRDWVYRYEILTVLSSQLEI